MKDQGAYCCRVQIPGLGNDQKHVTTLKVHRAPKSTKPAVTTSLLGHTDATSYVNRKIGDGTNKPLSGIIPDPAQGTQGSLQSEEPEESPVKSDSLIPIIAGVVVFIIMSVCLGGLAYLWRYYKIRNKDTTRDVITLQGLQGEQHQAEENIYS
ncbi:hepatitis A virus cellular receptor 2 homolog [Hyperolius riggenbachi]|uniref:hepatitis A virus cellular receptor 2 homolog n=1 Tax=Hyperolius riggenbachi TaxID=752182 RepID=UPI0035A27688